MSTPAIITAKNNPTIGIYIHYDGDDKKMIENIIDIARKNRARNPNDDEEYGMARIICACEEYFQTKTTDFGVFAYIGKHNHGEFFHYTIDKDWNVDQIEVD